MWQQRDELTIIIDDVIYTKLNSAKHTRLGAR